jgi:hypothetical protein
MRLRISHLPALFFKPFLVCASFSNFWEAIFEKSHVKKKRETVNSVFSVTFFSPSALAFFYSAANEHAVSQKEGGRADAHAVPLRQMIHT